MSYVFGGQLSTDKLILQSVYIYILAFPVSVGIIRSITCHVDTSIYCCVFMLHLNTTKTKTTILGMTANEMGD